MAENSYLIGVDLGTAGTKVAIFDEEGNLITDAYEESRLSYPKPGWVEQELDDFYRSACKTIKEAFIDYTYTSFSGFSNTKDGYWSEELCQISDVPLDKLPRIISPWEIIGKLSSQAARDSGLIPGIPIARHGSPTKAGESL